MSKHDTDRRRSERRGRFWPATLLAVAAVAAAAGALVLAFQEVDTSPAAAPLTVSSVAMATPTTASTIVIPSGAIDESPGVTVTSTLSARTTVFVRPVPGPDRIVIPSIGVDAEIVEVGLEEDGDMEVPPFGSAGWYRLGPLPGAAGPAVVVAHVDSTKGPDVFYRLSELRPGDEFTVSGRAEESARFVIDSIEMVLKSELPRERIWVSTDRPVIRLITCGGEFDRSSRHYLSNVIVYGHLAGQEPSSYTPG